MRTKGKRIGWVVGSTGLMAAVSLMMVLGPAMAGAVHPAVITVVAPYKGASTGYNSWSVSGCGKAKITSPATFNLKTGAGGFSGSAAAKTCGKSFGGVGGSGYGSTSSEVQVAVKLPGHKGTTAVAATVALAWAGSNALVAGTCTTSATASYSSCYRSASVDLYGYAYVIDETNGTYSYATNYFPGAYNSSYNDTYCYSGTCYQYSYGTPGSFTNSMSFTWNFTVKSMVKSHVYALWFYFAGYVYASASTYNAVLTGASASASLNFATLGNGVTLTSVTET
jgi:hypothetical protein